MIKKYSLLLPIAFVISGIAISQTSKSAKKDDYDINKFIFRKVHLADPQEKIEISNISNIDVIDARADTSVIGLLKKNFRVPAFDKTEIGLKNTVSHFVNSYFNFSKKDSAASVLMVIKNLWLTNGFDPKTVEYEDNLIKRNKKVGGSWGYHGNFLDQYAENEDTSSGIAIKIEFYLKTQTNYYALYRYDSVFTGIYYTNAYGSKYLAQALTASLSKLIELAPSVFDIIKTKRPFSLDEIEKHNAKRFDLPILKDSLFHEGVYLTFDEFKNNNPSITKFEVKKDQLSDIIYVKQQDGTEYGTMNVWGYCDGKNRYVKLYHNFFLLQRKENAFYVYGAKKIDKNSYNNNPQNYMVGSAINPAPNIAVAPTMVIIPYLGNEKPRLDLQPFTIDWDTGKIY